MQVILNNRVTKEETLQIRSLFSGSEGAEIGGGFKFQSIVDWIGARRTWQLRIGAHARTHQRRLIKHEESEAK